MSSGKNDTISYSNDIYYIFKEHFDLPYDNISEFNIHAISNQFCVTDACGKISQLKKLTSIYDSMLILVTIDELLKILSNYIPIPKNITNCTLIFKSQEPFRIVCRSRSNVK